ncbi:MAG: DUF721 domain-containing protein [Sphingomonadaceae bacterium]
MTKPTKSDASPIRARGGRARAVSEIVPDIGRAAFRRFGFVQSSVVSRWADIVGARYSEISAPESIRFPVGKRSDGVLTLIVAGAHAPMMQHVAPIIIERVNRFFGYTAVARLVMRQGTLPAPRSRAAPRPSIAVPVELGESLRTVADPELRAVLESLAQGVAAKAMPVLGKVG